MEKVSFRTKRRIVRIRRVIRWWPWAVSAGVHVAILVVLSTIVLVSQGKPAEKPEIIPEARLGKIAPGLPLYQRIRSESDVSRAQTLARDLHRQIAPPTDSSVVSSKDLRPGSGGNEDFDPIGVGFSGGQQGAGDRQPLALPGGELARLNPSAPVTRFFASGGNAYNIVYLVDRSYSMIGTIEPLKRELKRSIRELQPMQKFHIIFFSAGQPAEGPAGNLTWATDRNKDRYFAFIDAIRAQGATDPQWALQRALQTSPDLIYLLTDGIFSDQIATKITQWAKLHKVKINTIAYVWESGGGTLRKIAEQTGGVYRFVSGEQLE